MTWNAKKRTYEEQKSQYETARDQLAQISRQLPMVEAAQTEVTGQIEVIEAQLDGLTEEDEAYVSLLEQKTALEAKQTELAQQLFTMQEQKKSRLSWTRGKMWYFSHWEILPCIPHISISITDLWLRAMRRRSSVASHPSVQFPPV